MIVSNGGVRLATTDLGGDGPDLVLMHGLGGSRKAMRKVAALLPDHHIITMDLRGHGKSSTGPWDFPAAVADLHAVIEHYELDKPYVAGHSLGGMIALQYALSGHPVAGAVNIDGWGPGVTERILDEDPRLVSARLGRIADGELSLIGRAITAPTRISREGTTRQVMRLLHEADVVAWHRDAPCRSLAINATAPSPGLMRWLMGSEVARLQNAHRRGLRRDLAALAQENPLVQVVEVDATHGLIFSHPESVATAIRSFTA